MLRLLGRLPVPVLVVLGLALVGLFAVGLTSGTPSRAAGFVGIACLVLAGAAVARARRRPGRGSNPRG